MIGEHTDYNQGFVLPFAIGYGCVALVARSAGWLISMSSAQLPGAVVVPAAELAPGRIEGWSAYVAGVVWALRERGHRVPGLSIKVDSDVPLGAGLSSSAALTCSVAVALDDLLELGLDRADLLAVTMRAENEFAGAPTGGMDQLAALAGRADHALFCDMRSFDADVVPFDLAAHGLSVLVIDTGVSHGHAGGEYGVRRAGCERAARQLGLPSLRDVVDLGAALVSLRDDELRRYTRHVVTENERVRHTVDLLRVGSLTEIGPLLTASHASLRDDFRVSAPELDVAVEALLSAGALGARMTGGGFGGSAIALVPVSAVSPAITAVCAAFADHDFAAPTAFTVRPARGVHPIG